jgi:hypothetical protein
MPHDIAAPHRNRSEPDGAQHVSAVAKSQLDDWLDEALAGTFPASDPIASPPGGGAVVIGLERQGSRDLAPQPPRG